MQEVKTQWQENTNTLSQFTESVFFHTDDEEEDAEESNFEHTSSNSPKKDSSTHSFCFKNRQERASLRGNTCIIINVHLSPGVWDNDCDTLPIT